MSATKKSKEREVAEAFLGDYADPEIEKRLFYEVWADRYGLSEATRRKVWREVRSITCQIAAIKRQAAKRQRTAVGAAAEAKAHAPWMTGRPGG